MRANTAAATAAITGGALAIIYGTIEATAAAAGLTISDGIRTLAATVIALAVLGPLGLAILCRQSIILHDLGSIKRVLITEDQAQAQRDYDNIRRELGDDGDNITRLYPKE
jgi:hypothetical protein